LSTIFPDPGDVGSELIFSVVMDYPLSANAVFKAIRSKLCGVVQLLSIVVSCQRTNFDFTMFKKFLPLFLLFGGLLTGCSDSSYSLGESGRQKVPFCVGKVAGEFLRQHQVSDGVLAFFDETTVNNERWQWIGKGLSSEGIQFKAIGLKWEFDLEALPNQLSGTRAVIFFTDRAAALMPYVPAECLSVFIEASEPLNVRDREWLRGQSDLVFFGLEMPDMKQLVVFRKNPERMSAEEVVKVFYEISRR
jgi:hypothetical protein